jgi:transcriptional regulator with XRE-family HTH domain
MLNTTARCISESDRQAMHFQRNFIVEAIKHMRTQENLAKLLCVSQQTISKYRDGTNALSLARIIRIAKAMGKESLDVQWS